MYRVHIPASSGNMCVGFDSTGLALQIYNSIDFEARKSGLVIEMDAPAPFIPTDGRNLIVRAARRAADCMGKRLPGLYLKQYNRIPHTRGLGSSAACIVGGILLADTLLGAGWSRERVLSLASEMEGHPDNVAPAIYGGVCISAKAEDGYLVRPVPVGEDLAVCVAIPSFTLSTRKAREVLPASVPMKDAVSNIANMGLLVASLYERDYTHLGAALHDRLHEPYRKTLIQGFDDVIQAAYDLGAYGACLSGAGPTILIFLPAGKQDFERQLQEKLRSIPGGWKAVLTDFDRRGAFVETL